MSFQESEFARKVRARLTKDRFGTSAFSLGPKTRDDSFDPELHRPCAGRLRGQVELLRGHSKPFAHLRIVREREVLPLGIDPTGKNRNLLPLGEYPLADQKR